MNSSPSVYTKWTDEMVTDCIKRYQGYNKRTAKNVILYWTDEPSDIGGSSRAAVENSKGGSKVLQNSLRTLIGWQQYESSNGGVKGVRWDMKAAG